VTLRLHTLPAQNPRNSPEEALAVAEGAFRAYVDRFGPYACTELDIVDVPVNIGGYEFPGMVYVETGKRVRGSESAYDYLLAHEMAHQWWYNIVGSQTVAEPWLDESFATYGHYLYLEHSGQAEAAEDRLAYWQRTYGPRRPHQPPVNSPTTDFAGWSGYRRTVYVQGALFLHTLREEMGDEAFFRLLQRLQQQYRYRRPTTIRFLTTAEEVAGRDLNPLFEEWFAIQAEGAR
jgi:aminopeptidase N